MSRDKRRKSDGTDKWYAELVNALRLEGTTPSGRVNLAGVAIVAVFCLIYAASDSVQYLISAISDTVKTISLGQDIYHPYEGVSVLKAVTPVVVVFVLCLAFLIIDSRLKGNLNKQCEENSNEGKRD